jgi:hypothetical protein
MERVPKGLYTLEFRAEAVKLVLDQGCRWMRLRSDYLPRSRNSR